LIGVEHEGSPRIPMKGIAKREFTDQIIIPHGSIKPNGMTQSIDQAQVLIPHQAVPDQDHVNIT
jgi:hypothetical protein